MINPIKYLRCWWRSGWGIYDGHPWVKTKDPFVDGYGEYVCSHCGDSQQYSAIYSWSIPPRMDDD